MRGILKTVGIFLISCFLYGCGGIENSLSSQEKIEDFEYLYEDLKENYPYLELNERIYGVNFEKNKEKYLKWIEESRNYEEYVGVLQEIIGELNNSHSRIFSKEEYEMYRKTYEKLQLDGWYEINKRALNDKRTEKNYKNTMGKENRNIKKMEELRFNAYDIEEGKIGYIELPSFLERDSLEDEIEEVHKYLEKVKKYDALVLDIRGNTGGSTRQWQNLMSLIIDRTYTIKTYDLYRMGSNIKALEKFIGFQDIKNLKLDHNIEEINQFSKYIENIRVIEPSKKSINFKGQLYLLIDESVYSSSEALAIMFKEAKIGLLVGETTSGDGIGSDPIIKRLPHSGILYQYTKSMGVLANGEINEEVKTMPDFKVVDAKKKKDKNTDNCIEKILELERNK